MHLTKYRLGIALSTVSLAVSVGIGALAYSWNGQLEAAQDATEHQQAVAAQAQLASDCWDEVLVVALHDHLTPPQRAALIKRANHCADITPPPDA